MYQVDQIKVTEAEQGNLDQIPKWGIKDLEITN